MPEELKQLETAKYQGVEPYYMKRPIPDEPLRINLDKKKL